MRDVVAGFERVERACPSRTLDFENATLSGATVGPPSRPARHREPARMGIAIAVSAIVATLGTAVVTRRLAPSGPVPASAPTAAAVVPPAVLAAAPTTRAAVAPAPVEVSRLELLTQPQGAEVYTLDGRRVGTTPLVVMVARGHQEAAYVFKKAGFAEERRTLSSAEDARFEFRLTPIAPAPASKPSRAARDADSAHAAPKDNAKDTYELFR
jgi:hypothetical protein